MPDWRFDLTYRVRTILGRPIRIEEKLAEVPDPRLAEIQALTLARHMDTNQPIMLKIRYELRPESFGIRDQVYLQTMRERAQDDYLEEVKLVEDVEEIGHGPAYLAHVTQGAGEMFPYPDGIVNFIIMTRVPGENVAHIFLTLSDQQLESIRRQLAFTLEANDKLYIVDFSYMSFTNPNAPGSTPITVDHMYVLGFDIWHHGEFEPGRRGGPSGREGGFDNNQRAF
ncbi:hypothetical protein IFM46972_04678 [Aspergillus udagawae]|uniref:Uncharacterized protein n=1 Tax=Aspergillus udagawae TaxID=91492 RepID=A0A8H3RS59_9EURO|nr:hypothetical protein IFM46972_04678 [Aspergillus udagawae]